MKERGRKEGRKEGWKEGRKKGRKEVRERRRGEGGRKGGTEKEKKCKFLGLTPNLLNQNLGGKEQSVL